MKKLVEYLKKGMAVLLAVSLAVGMENGLVLAAGDKTETASIEEKVRTVDEAYLVTYHVGEYSLQTDTDGNVFAIIDGEKYNYGEQWSGQGFLEKLFALENQNVVYELYNDEIVATYTVAEVIEPKIVIDSNVKDGVIYQNGKFNQSEFELIVAISNNLQTKFKDLLSDLNSIEKECLSLSMKELLIKPSDSVNFGTTGWWLWEKYEQEISEKFEDVRIAVGGKEEYRYAVNLKDSNALANSERYNINFELTVTHDLGTVKRNEKVTVGNLDYQKEKTEEKKKTSDTGKTLTAASTELNGINSAIQFSGNYFSSEQTQQINEFVNAWIAELILAKYIDKSALEKNVTEKITNEWLKNLGLKTSVLTIPGTIDATTFLETKTKDGEKVYIQFDIKLMDFNFGNGEFPTMASGSGNVTVYNKEGIKLDSSVILPAYANICAFCEQLQKVAKDTLFSGIKESFGIFGVTTESTAEAFSSVMMTKLLNWKYTKNIFKTVSAKDMKAVLKKITTEAADYGAKKIYKLSLDALSKTTEVSVKCPVDVKVYDSDGNLCGVVNDNVVDDAYQDIHVAVVGEQKNIYLTGDEYTFELTGTDAGTMDYEIKEFDETGNVIREILYENVALSDGCKYYSYVPEEENINSVVFDLRDENKNSISPTKGGDLEEDLEEDGENKEIIEEGKCGDNLTYQLDVNGVLRISGTGEMDDYDYYGRYYAPWYENGSSVKEVLIEAGVTSIGRHAFFRCSSLTSVTIPSGVTSIGFSAFYDCSRLTSVTIPAGVTSIGWRTFSGCSSLESVTIPAGVTSIDYHAFENCSSLTSVTIPEGVTEIGDGAFEYCSRLTSVTISEGVTSIGDSAFEGCSSLESVTIPESVTSIGNCAFEGCSSLTSVTIPEGVTRIDWSAFEGCSSLESVTIPESVTSIGYSAFEDCNSLTSVTILGGVTRIGYGMFLGCSSLTSVTIPGSVTSIDEYAFENCSSLTSVTIPSGVTSIGYAAFLGCSSLTSVTIPSGVTEIGESTFHGCSDLTSVTIPEGVTSIGKGTFAGCSSLTSVIIPTGVTEIDSYTFGGCSSLTSVTIPEGVTSIGKGTFAGCSSLTSVIIPTGVTEIDSYTFDGCSSLTSVTIPEGVTSIGWYAFAGCSSLESVTIPGRVTSIGEGTFYGCSSLTSVIIPTGVTEIDSYTFNGCSSLTSVTIPESVTVIGDEAFRGCSSLESVTIPEGVTSIDNGAFRDCSSLESVTIPESVTSIGEDAFWCCSSLTSVTIPESVRSIGRWAFYGCSSLTSVTIPDGITEIGDTTFCGCSSLTSITIPESVRSIGFEAFEGCSSLTDVYYAGTQAQWNSIEIHYDNKGLTNATIHYGKGCAHAHTTIINKKAATCTAKGYSGDTKCSDCGAIIKKGTVTAAKGHKIVVDKAVPATCTKAGKTEGSHCSVCNKVLKAQQTIEAKGHKEVIENAIPATCTEPGYSGYTVCDDCGEIIKNGIVIEAKGHTYKTTTTAATLTRNGSITTKCTVCGAKKTPKTIYRPKTIKVSKTACTYNGKNQKPAITVKDSQGKTISSKYYTVSYTNCKNVGEATATVTFKGNYRGTKKLTYKIAPKNTSSLQVGAISKGFTVKWKKQSSQTTGYQIQYSTSSKFNGAKTMTIKNNRTTSYTAKKLKAGQKYYVRIRTYKRAKVGGTYQNIYSTWSKAKTVTAKK